MDLLQEWLNGRYEQVLESTDWTGIKAHANLETSAAYQSGTDKVTLTVGSVSVVGTATTWASSIVGKRFYRPGDTNFYTVVTRADSTHLTLDRVYEGTGVDLVGTVYTAQAYVLMQHLYSLPSDCASVIEILDPRNNLPLIEFTESEMDAAAGARTLVGDPSAYTVYDDTSESAPPVLHQVEFYPPPQYARGFTLRYTRAAFGFDGTNVGSFPLPFVSDNVLLYGCRAELHAHEGDLKKAADYEGKFTQELGRLMRVEHQQRRAMPKIQMAARFTRHRMARASRGLGRVWGPGAGGPN